MRAGLQAIPSGQQEAATALGISYWRTMHLVVLPQALRIVIPGMLDGTGELPGLPVKSIQETRAATGQTSSSSLRQKRGRALVTSKGVAR